MAEDKQMIVEKNKKHILLYIFLFIIVLFCIILLYSRYISTSIIKIEENPIYTDKISDSADGIKIVQISDILYGSTVLDNGLDKIVKKINELNPDIVVFTGDLIIEDYKISHKSIKYITDKLKNIDSNYGKYTIRGENDYKNDTFIEIMDNANFKYLDNNYDLIHITNTDVIYLGGINSSSESKVNYDNLKYDNNVYKIMLMHEPYNINEITEIINPDLALAGHTLLGSFRLPFIGGISYDSKSKKYSGNYYKVKNTEFYISSGIGTLDYPFRFMNNPSINLYRIIKKNGQ